MCNPFGFDLMTIQWSMVWCGAIQLQKKAILHSSNLSLFQSFTLPILHSSNHTLFQSYTLHSYTIPIKYFFSVTLFQSCTLFQSYALSIILSFNVTLFQFSILHSSILHSSNLALRGVAKLLQNIQRTILTLTIKFLMAAAEPFHVPEQSDALH